jgi:hypothetical protein
MRCEDRYVGAEVLPSLREVSDPWTMAKDGK